MSFFKEFGVSNVITILSVIFACGLSWGKINSSIDELKNIRTNDLMRLESQHASEIVRIEKIENSYENLKNKVHDLEKSNVQLSSDIKYIISSIDEVKKILQSKNVAMK